MKNIEPDPENIAKLLDRLADGTAPQPTEDVDELLAIYNRIVTALAETREYIVQMTRTTCELAHKVMHDD